MNSPARRVLVIDDEKDLLPLARAVLEREGLGVDETSAGAAALELLREGSYDAVLCDMNLDDMGGPEIFRWLEANQPERAHGFILMTGDPDDPRCTQLVKAGVVCLPKPFGIGGLRDAVRQVLARKETEWRGEATDGQRSRPTT